jgi:hypothetical protein
LFGSDESYHLSSFGDFNSFGFIFTVDHGEWGSYDFIKNAWHEAIQEKSNGLFVANGITSLSYQVFEV